MDFDIEKLYYTSYKIVALVSSFLFGMATCGGIDWLVPVIVLTIPAVLLLLCAVAALAYSFYLDSKEEQV